MALYKIYKKRLIKHFIVHNMNGKITYSIVLKIQSDLCYISYLYKARLD